MAFLMMNAANMAYNKAIKKTRDPEYLKQSFPAWMTIFAQNLPEKIKSTAEAIVEVEEHRRARLLKRATHPYLRLGWFVYSRITSQVWFEGFVMMNILLVGLFTGLDLENRGRNAAISTAVESVSTITSAVFTVEVALKLIIEGFEPLNYFRDKENGSFNTFDATIVLAGYVFIGFEGGSAIGALRMLRLVRLLTFIKGVPQLRAIMAGLVNGINSVTYIVMLLALLIYLFAIMGTLIFGENDPARFGSVMTSMLSLFQVSTLASWTSIAYTSWYGCGQYLGDPYAVAVDTDPPSRIQTWVGNPQGYKCNVSTPKPIETFFFFSFYIIITAWVVLSLFIGVMSMGMFEAFQEMKEKIKEQRYREQLEKNNSDNHEDDSSSDEEEGADETEKKKKKKKKKKKPPRQKMKQDKPVTLEQGATLRELIDAALSNELPVFVPQTKFEALVVSLQERSLKVRDSDLFERTIVLTILLVGVVIGVDTDQTMHCERQTLRIEDGRDDDDVASRSWCGDVTLSYVVGLLSQIIFTVEAFVKITAEGLYPMQYFYDRKNGSWNCLDLFVVVTGYIEMSPLAFIFEAFPVVVLRLLRLLRVFRLAKALPRLRSIVDALMSGMSSVGWIVALVCIFNYILACMCMLFLQRNDPVHFGTLGRSMFSVLRIETLDSWDQILYISMMGCENYPGYPLLDLHPVSQCKHSFGFGWIGAGLFFFIVIFGAYVLPTVLVGIVSISFDEASRRNEALQEMEDKMEKVAKDAYEQDPVFFAPARIIAIRNVFDAMDADGELSLDVNEMAPFYQYAFDILFGVDLTPNATEALFHLMDMDGDTELGFAEFLLFVMVIKRIELMCIDDPAFALRTFPPGEVRRIGSGDGLSRDDAWRASVAKMDKEAISEAWTKVVRFLDAQSAEALAHSPGGASFKLAVKTEADAKIKELFTNFDSDKDGRLDTEEIAIGLVSLGVLVNKRQVKAFSKAIDRNKDGFISYDEFHDQVTEQRALLKEKERNEERQEAKRLLGLEHKDSSSFSSVETSTPSNMASGSCDGGGSTRRSSSSSSSSADGQRGSTEEGVSGSTSSSSSNSDSGGGGSMVAVASGGAGSSVDARTEVDMMACPLGEVVGWCSRLVSARFMQEVRAKHGILLPSPPSPHATGQGPEGGAVDVGAMVSSDRASEAFARLLADRITGEFHWFDHPDGPLAGRRAAGGGASPSRDVSGGGRSVDELAERTLAALSGAGVMVRPRPPKKKLPQRLATRGGGGPHPTRELAATVRRPETPPARGSGGGNSGGRAFFGETATEPHGYSAAQPKRVGGAPPSPPSSGDAVRPPWAGLPPSPHGRHLMMMQPAPPDPYGGGLQQQQQQQRQPYSRQQQPALPLPSTQQQQQQQAVHYQSQQVQHPAWPQQQSHPPHRADPLPASQNAGEWSRVRARMAAPGQSGRAPPPPVGGGSSSRNRRQLGGSIERPPYSDMSSGGGAEERKWTDSTTDPSPHQQWGVF